MSNTRKSWLVVLVVAVVALAFAVPAFATIGGAGYLNWSTLGGANGTSPHGGYSTTTQKCVVCHAVHNASITGEVLLGDTVANACVYCHVNGASAYTQVYNSVAANYAGTDYNNAHNSWTVGAVDYGVKCTQCHQVHAADSAMTNNAYLTQRLLSGDKVLGYDVNAGAPQSTDSSNTALSKWCTKCHGTSLGSAYGYYNTAYDGQTHVMTTATADYAGAGASGTYAGRVAWNNSNYCSSCHASDFQTAAWPHYTTGQRFLVTAANASAASAAATSTHQDGICLRCHRDNAGNGIGLGF
jgi:predicted CXXCH cytochrome family protein